MRQLSLLCMRRPLACVAVWLALAVLTLLAVPRIAVEGLPPLQVPVLRVITLYPQVPPEAVELEITIPLENALSAVAGVARIESISQLGITRTTLHLRLGSSAHRAAFRVREQIDALYPSLPHGAAKPVVLSSELARQPAAVLAV
ncbi:MAG: efflux RND transporter permease subunit, partial [Spirochaeta sp.]|nr:efflux RND transporter permease subunit [Spirochaeta sp.]